MIVADFDALFAANCRILAHHDLLSSSLLLIHTFFVLPIVKLGLAYPAIVFLFIAEQNVANLRVGVVDTQLLEFT